MKFIQNNLKKRLKSRKLTIAEVIKRMNTIQFQVDPTKRKITRNFIYHTLADHTPTPDKMYLLSAILDVRPDLLFLPSVDDQKWEAYKQIVKDANFSTKKPSKKKIAKIDK
jgi:transcriptional regulator with XRE-family HTH domain